MTTFLARRSQFHQSRLVGNITAGNLKTRTMVAGMQAWFQSHGLDAAGAHRKALAAVYGLVQQHASMLAFVEAFWVMAVMFFALLPFLLLLRYSKAKPQEKPPSDGRSEKVRLQSPAIQEETEDELELVLH
jgi:DHA2 family multidrug resistance protein